MQPSSIEYDRSSTGRRLKNILFTITVTVALALGFYSLFLAYTNAGKMRPLTNKDLLRTATAEDTEKIETALGGMTDRDFVYVVLEIPDFTPVPDVRIAAQNAARILNDSGLVASVRLLNSGDPDFSIIVAQNGIDKFPSVLAVKNKGGIVWVKEHLSEDYLLYTYYSVWGKTSSCNDAKSAVY